ncbi:hypothetical protein ACIBK8_13440 [Streptomyces sp. NPDC050161]|uniref:hypothetical protein n=1 Tax=Streptomyces sp. NPDC050161 TaxID=3365604 RepID=UPI00379A01C1
MRAIRRRRKARQSRTKLSNVQDMDTLIPVTETIRHLPFPVGHVYLVALPGDGYAAVDTSVPGSAPAVLDALHLPGSRVLFPGDLIGFVEGRAVLGPGNTDRHTGARLAVSRTGPARRQVSQSSSV